MALVYLTSTASDQRARFSRRDYERLSAFSQIDTVRKHALTESPVEADIILFVGSSEPAFRDVTQSNLYRKYRDKSVLFDARDRIIALLPGIYAGLDKRWANLVGNAVLSGFYLRVSENDSLDLSEPIESSAYLYSFVGNSSNHAVRKEVFRLKDRRAYLRDSSQDSVKQSDGVTGSNATRGKHYRELIANSKFVLCPRGIGVSTWRLFESMRAGRVPVIISDQWTPPVGPDWETFSIRIRERDVTSIPSVLASREGEAPTFGMKARRAWLDFFDRGVIFNTVIDMSVRALAGFHSRQRWRFALRRLQFADPHFARHWLLSPWARRVVFRSGLDQQS